jgi:hypothetical protein
VAGGGQREGPYTRTGTVVGVISLVLTYLGVAFSLGWPPFQDKGTASSSPAPAIRAIQLPVTVFGFQTLNNETRQSWKLGQDQVHGTAYAYGYYQDDEGIWLDATAVAGGDSVTVVEALLDRERAAGQAAKTFGATTCVWEQDADPDTPRHAVICFRVDRDRGLALVVNTHTADVGDFTPANLTDELWNRLAVS